MKEEWSHWPRVGCNVRKIGFQSVNKSALTFTAPTRLTVNFELLLIVQKDQVCELDLSLRELRKVEKRRSSNFYGRTSLAANWIDWSSHKLNIT